MLANFKKIYILYLIFTDFIFCLWSHDSICSKSRSPNGCAAWKESWEIQCGFNLQANCYLYSHRVALAFNVISRFITSKPEKSSRAARFCLCSFLPHPFMSICPERATCPPVLAPLFFLPPTAPVRPCSRPSLCHISWTQTQAFQWLPSSSWLRSSGWSPGATVTRCWPAVVALVWATQLPDGLSPLDPSGLSSSFPVWPGNPSVDQARTFFSLYFFSLIFAD